MLCTFRHRTHWGIFLIRVILGVVFIAHGFQKVFGLFGGSGLAGFMQYITSIHLPAIVGYYVPFAELIGGILLLLGIAAELGALLAAPVMVGAIFTVHWQHGFFSQNNGFEYPLVLLIGLVAIIIGGPGIWYVWCPCKLLNCKCK